MLLVTVFAGVGRVGLGDGAPEVAGSDARSKGRAGRYCKLKAEAAAPGSGTEGHRGEGAGKGLKEPKATIGTATRARDEVPLCHGRDLDRFKSDVAAGERRQRGWRVRAAQGCGGNHPGEVCTKKHQ